MGVRQDRDTLHANLHVKGLKIGLTRGPRPVPIDTSLALRVALDRRSGQVMGLRGADRLQAFFLRGRAPAADDVYANVVRGVVNDDSLREVLEKLLHLLPVATTAARSWSLRLDASPGGERRCTLEDDPRGQTVRHLLVPPSEHAAWVIEGAARFSGGRLVESVVSQRSDSVAGGDDEFVFRRLSEEAPR